MSGGTKFTLAMARDRGQNDRRVGKPRDKCPFSSPRLVAVWLDGWDITDAVMPSLRRTTKPGDLK